MRATRPRTQEHRDRARQIREMSEKVPAEYRYELLGDDNDTLLCSDLEGRFSGLMKAYVIIAGGMKLREGFIERQWSIDAERSLRLENMRIQLRDIASDTYRAIIRACSASAKVVHWTIPADDGTETDYIGYENVPEIVDLRIPESSREQMHSINVLGEKLSDIRDGHRYEVIAWDEPTLTFYALRPMKDPNKIPKDGAWVYGFLGADDGRVREFMGKSKLGTTGEEKAAIRDRQAEMRRYAITAIKPRAGSPIIGAVRAAYDYESTCGIFKLLNAEREYVYTAVLPPREKT